MAADNAARGRLYAAAEHAMAEGFTLAEALQAVHDAHSSLLADRSFAADEQDRDLYPHLDDPLPPVIPDPTDPKGRAV